MQGELVNGATKLTVLEELIAELRDVEQPSESQKERLKQLKEQYNTDFSLRLKSTINSLLSWLRYDKPLMNLQMEAGC